MRPSEYHVTDLIVNGSLFFSFVKEPESWAEIFGGWEPILIPPPSLFGLPPEWQVQATFTFCEKWCVECIWGHIFPCDVMHINTLLITYLNSFNICIP